MEEGLNALASDANQNYLIYGAVALVVLILLFVLVRMFSSRNAIGGRRQRRNARVSIVEVAPIDQQRRLVLVRRDNVEHLILIGGQSDLVVEHGILTYIPERDAPAMRGRPTRNQPTQEPVVSIPPETSQISAQNAQEPSDVAADLERIQDDLKTLDISARGVDVKEPR